MAKQNVTFVERHVEKLVIAVAGAVLLAVAVIYLIDSPHEVEVAGRSLGPREFYAALGDKANLARRRMQDVTPDATDGEKNTALSKTFENHATPLPRELLVANVSLNPPVPEFDGMERFTAPGKVDVVAILPPTKPVLSTGRAPARLPAPKVVYVGANPDTGIGELPLTSDWHWVTVTAAISRKAQHATFVKAGYDALRLELIVTEVRAERQELRPNGQWSKPQPVEGYAPNRIIGTRGRAKIELVREEDGYSVTPDDSDYIHAYRSEFDEESVQAEVLRPPFQQYLKDSASSGGDRFAYEWQVPKELEASDGSTIDLTDRRFNIEFPPDEDAKFRTVGSSTGKRGLVDRNAATGRPERNAIVWARDLLEEANQALADGEYLKAEELWGLIVANDEVPARTRDSTQQLLDKHQRDFERARRDEQVASRREEEKGICRLGKDVEPLWLNDTTVEPGKTYRYRVSLVAVNQYAGSANFLKNPQDARTLVNQGQWSPWSDPITVRPAKYLFVTAIRGDGNTARVEIHEWADGRWTSAGKDLTVGSVVAFQKGRNGPTFSYDAIILAIDLARPYQQRLENRGDDGFRYKAGVTEAVVLVNSNGETLERLVADDILRKREVTAAIKEEEKERQEKLKLRSRSPDGERRLRARTPHRGPERPPRRRESIMEE